MEPTLRQAVRAAAGREDVRDAIRALYSRVQQEIDLRRPICRQSGRCCRFDEFGHRLYVTTMELAAFLAGLEADADAINPGGCRFQVDGLCSVHPIRPFGCRIFFCDPTAERWQEEQYERFHHQLRGLHEQLNVPYFYVEWRKALEECLARAEQ